MKLNGPLLSAGYLLALGLILVPLAEAVISVWPFQLGAVSWRFGAAGIISRGLMTSLMGLVVGGGIALAAGHRRVLMGLSLICSLAAPVLLAGLVLMALDGVQFRGNVTPEARTTYDLAAVGGVLKFLHAILVSALLAWGSWIAARRTQKSRAEEGRGSKLAVGPR